MDNQKDIENIFWSLNTKQLGAVKRPNFQDQAGQKKCCKKKPKFKPNLPMVSLVFVEKRRLKFFIDTFFVMF